MRILLASNAQYFPAHGGGERSNRMLIEALAERGHRCFIVTRIDRFGDEGAQRFATELAARQVDTEPAEHGVRFRLGGVDVIAATHPPSFRAFFVSQRDAFQPDVIIASTDDPAQLLLEAALEDPHAATVFLARATVALPFGPDAAFTSAEKTEFLRRADAVIGVSEYVASYMRDRSGIPAVHVAIALPEPGPHPRMGSFDHPYVTLVNPCAVKGLAVLLALAEAMPHLQFAAVPTWGTTSDDLHQIRCHPNITILPKVDRINDLFARTRVLLVPSLWTEARSRLVVEAMLAGVPVIASNLGGLPEAKMHVPYVLPLRPIEGYSHKLNEQMVPVALVPPQDIGPWKEALNRLTTDRAHWEELAELSRSTALAYADATTIEPFERFISTLVRKSRPNPAALSTPPSDQLSRLSPDRRRLLEIRLKKQAAAAITPALPFGGAEKTEHVRLLCFPHAGGGASSFRPWKAKLEDVCEVACVQYPGHESRRSERLAGSLAELVATLTAELKPALAGSFVLFGHSMGAAVAFELARFLRSKGQAGPLALIVSGTRAPQYRLNHQAGPDPSPEEFLAQLQRLGGLPMEVESNRRLMDSILPALAADAALYRRYSYLPEPPLAIPILALGGISDPQVSAEHLNAWRQQTTERFEMQQFEGGHFYHREREEELLACLRTFFKTIKLKSAS
jgi:surfactin synthase thioesterase subunit/glycosyltransferase involved in cell wall biosynthesis